MPQNLRQLAVSTLYYISGSIFGPLILFLGLGYLLDRVFQSKPKMLIIGFVLAFLTSNIMLFRKISQVNRQMESYAPNLKKVDEQDSSKIETDK